MKAPKEIVEKIKQRCKKCGKIFFSMTKKELCLECRDEKRRKYMREYMREYYNKYMRKQNVL